MTGDVLDQAKDVLRTAAPSTRPCWKCQPTASPPHHCAEGAALIRAVMESSEGAGAWSDGPALAAIDALLDKYNDHVRGGH